MILVKLVINQPRARLMDLIRDLLYSSAPIICLAIVWAIGWAKSIEARIINSDRNHNELSTVIIHAENAAAAETEETQPLITSVADPN